MPPSGAHIGQTRSSFAVRHSLPTTTSLLSQAMTSPFANALVTSVSVSVGESVKTTVKMDLYTSSFGKLQKQKERLTLALLPRYSGMFVIALGILIITGPMLLWFLESNVTSLTESNYGMLIMAKIILAIVMIGFGGYHQFKIQKTAEKNFSSGKSFAYNKLSKPLKAEAMLGIALLAVVALLVLAVLKLLPPGPTAGAYFVAVIVGIYF